MTELEILNSEFGGIKIKDMTAMQFFQWLSKKLNGVVNASSEIVALNTLLTFPPMSKTYPEGEKIKIIQKLIKNNIKI
jgi:hypothetical protein